MKTPRDLDRPELTLVAGSQLLYTVKVRLDDAKNEIVVRTYYDRAR